MEQLSDGPTPLQTLRDALPQLDTPTWADLLEERHAGELCPYPPCGNKPGKPYQAAGEVEVKVKLRGGGLVQKTAKTSAFCSSRCEERCEWAGGMIGTQRMELLEDIEQRRAKLARATRELAAASGRTQSQATAEATPRALPLPPLPTTDPGATADLLVGLTIVEKEAPVAPPVAPSLTSAQEDFERPLASASRTADPSRPRPGRPAASTPAASLLPFDTSNLTRTLLDATDKLAAAPGAMVRTAQPTQGFNGLPPPRWTSDPAMVDKAGRKVEWAAVDEDGESADVQDIMALALESRRVALEELEQERLDQEE